MRARLTAAIVGIAIPLGGILSAFAVDAAGKAPAWPQWRGPNRDAVSTEKGLLQNWPKQGPNLTWKTAGLGRGWGSVAIAGNRVYLLGQRGDTEFLIALNAADGKELWATKLGGAATEAGTPTVDGDKIYALGPLGDLVCVEATGGKELWRKSYLKDFGGSVPTWKYCESPLVDGDKLICSPGSSQATLVALNKQTGEVLWKCATPSGAGSGSGYSSPVISTGAGVRQYVQLLGDGAGCVGVAADSGKLLWNYPRVGNGTATIPTAIVDEDYVFCSSGYGTGSALLQLSKSGDKVNAKEVYFLKGNELQNHHGGLVRLGKYIYGGHGHNNGFPICIEMKTGKVVWGGDKRGPGTGSAAVVYADGQLYFRYENGLMALIGANPDSYQINGRFTIPDVKDPSWSHPVVAGGKLYLREQDQLFVYDVAAK